MAEYLYNQGGVTIDANGVRRYADGSSDTVDQSMLRGLTNPSMGSGSLAGINFNGGLSPTPQNYDNTSDPFSVGYGTPNQSAGNGQPFPTQTPATNVPFSVEYNAANPSAGTQAPATNPWQANTKPQSVGGLAGAMAGGQGVNAYQGGGFASQFPSSVNNAPANQGLYSGMSGAPGVGQYQGGGFSGVGGQPLGGGTANPYMPQGQSGQNKPMPYSGDIGGSMVGGNTSPYPMGGVPQAMQSNMQGGLEVNPYLSTMGANLTNEITSNFNRNVMPGMRSQMMAAGGIGGSREGVLQANALRDMNSTIGNALGNLYGQGYVQAGNQRLGEGNLQLGYGNLDRNINNDNLNWQLQGANFGLGIQDRLNNSNAIGLGAGQAIQDTPLNYYNNFADRANAIGQGFASTSQSGGGGSALTGALGGAQLGNQIGNWWNTSNQPNRGTDAWSGTNPSTWFNTGSLAD